MCVFITEPATRSQCIVGDVRFVTAYRGARCAVVVAACGALAMECSSPTTPCIDSSGRGDTAPLSIVLSCAPQGPNAQCSAAPSYTAYTYCPAPLSPVSWASSNIAIATVSSTGFVGVVTRGEVDITATSGNLGPQVWSALVDPQQSPQVLYFLSGLIRENDGSDTRISGATVEILDGYNSGRASAPSNQFGAYQINRVLTNVTFTVRASRPGYSPSIATYLVGGPNSTTGPPFLDFRLSRAPQ